MWILILVMMSGYNQKQMMSVEFSSKDNCLAAQKVMVNSYKEISAVCVQK